MRSAASRMRSLTVTLAALLLVKEAGARDMFPPASASTFSVVPCSGSIEPEVDATAIRACETLTMNIATDSQCAQSDVHIVFDHPERATEGRWIAERSEQILSKLIDLRGTNIEAAFVEFGNTYIGLTLPLTTDLDSV